MISTQTAMLAEAMKLDLVGGAALPLAIREVARIFGKTDAEIESACWDNAGCRDCVARICDHPRVRAEIEKQLEHWKFRTERRQR